MDNLNKTPIERIEQLEKRYEIIEIELGYIKGQQIKTDSEFLRIYEKIDSLKNMIITSLIASILTLVGIIAVFVKG